MIPVTPQPEPPKFSSRVREPGNIFLQEVPNPSSEQWKGKEYWRRVLPEMRDLYRGICAYCARKIPYSTGSATIDHFISKSVQPQLAYEWNNYRYVSSRFNARKGTQTILDPFTIDEDWFTIDFSSYFIRPNEDLPSDLQKRIEETIIILKLNDDEDLVEERRAWIQSFFDGQISFEHLEVEFPFIAHELARQNLTT
ncbi:MAG: hypothetical protein HUU32_15700 [Calditrichaceae bacterium]|nr:hypothetical protein [Calditrichia bacterium]NUQ42832.1 hypothetical protein [Calditrichaceae bacterium]